MLGTPMLVVGAALGHRLFQDYGIQTGADKLSEMVIGMVAGMMIAGILLIATLWLWTARLAR
jgi:nitrate reductase gamma subunit